MSRIRSKGTTLEIKFRKSLWKLGLRYRKNSPEYFGKPDLIFISKKTAIFLDSCFWHGCKQHCRLPGSNREYWFSKIQRNTQRDKKVNSKLRKQGWHVLRIWEHDLKSGKKEKMLAKIRAFLFGT